MPRYFTPRSETPKNVHNEASLVSHLLDMFVLENPSRVAEEWLVGLDSGGDLIAVQAQERGNLPQKAQEELSFNEVSGLAQRRLLFSDLSIFLVQLVEQPPNTPGVDDPVYLYGSLYGPLSQGGPWAAQEGQLTVTRADILEGLSSAASWAFRYPTGGGRCFSMLLPGERPEDINQGHGGIVAYALLAPELAVDDAANDIMVNQILYDVLSAMKEDMKTEGAPDNLPPLPVPNRGMYEQKLLSAGYLIEGNYAIKKEKKGLLSALFGKDKVQLPPQGTPEQYFNLAKEALKALPGWPLPKAQALRLRQLSKSTGGAARSVLQQPHSSMPQGYTPPPPPPPSRPRPSDWMNDFVESHHKPNTPAPRLTPAANYRPPAPPVQPKPSGKPDWMSDFDSEPSAPVPQRAAPAPRPAPQTKTPAAKKSNTPDWSKDFE